jgi:hypothetical protein
MSYDLLVYLKRLNMPSPEAWRAYISGAGFPVTLDTEFDIDSFSGFLPCQVNGETSGFQYYPSVMSPEEARVLGLEVGVDFRIQFSIGPQPLELVSALAASSVLAATSGGTLKDPQVDASLAADAAVSWARAQLSQSRA